MMLGALLLLGIALLLCLAAIAFLANQEHYKAISEIDFSQQSDSDTFGH